MNYGPTGSSSIGGASSGIGEWPRYPVPWWRGGTHPVQAGAV